MTNWTSALMDWKSQHQDLNSPQTVLVEIKWLQLQQFTLQISKLILKCIDGAGEMAHCLRILAVLAKDAGLIPQNLSGSLQLPAYLVLGDMNLTLDSHRHYFHGVLTCTCKQITHRYIKQIHVFKYLFYLWDYNIITSLLFSFSLLKSYHIHFFSVYQKIAF